MPVLLDDDRQTPGQRVREMLITRGRGWRPLVGTSSIGVLPSAAAGIVIDDLANQPRIAQHPSHAEVIPGGERRPAGPVRRAEV